VKRLEETVTPIQGATGIDARLVTMLDDLARQNIRTETNHRAAAPRLAIAAFMNSIELALLAGPISSRCGFRCS
jgi:hypothetical protein